jgi:FAD/FMN-containing dehydrogenase
MPMTELSFDPAIRRAYANDYGQIVHEQPRAVLRPESAEDIARTVAFARRSGLKIVARGAGHQPFGQAQVDDGIVIDMRSLQHVRTLSADSVEVDAGASWRTVLQATLSKDLAPPVLTKFLDLTVGGTLSIGGVGVASLRHGAQVDQVLALQVVTGQGDVLECSAAQRRDLFEAALAGQGQCAIITRTTLRLALAPRHVREYTLPYPDLPTLIEDGTRIALDERFEGAVAMIVPADGRWKYALTPIRHLASPATSDDTALLRDLHFIRGAEHTRDVAYLQYLDEMPPIDFTQSHADLGLLMPQRQAMDLIGAALPRLVPEDLGGVQGIRLFFWQRASFTRPLLRVPEERLICYAALVRSPTSEPDMLARTIAGNRVLYELTRSRGGMSYPFAAIQMTREDWRRHYGDEWHAIDQSKRRYDPDAVLASGPNLHFT